MINIGFTGTQVGMTVAQKAAVRSLLPQKRWTLHHGDCIGADAEMHALAVNRVWAQVVLHPPDNDSKRAFCERFLRSARPSLTTFATHRSFAKVLMV